MKANNTTENRVKCYSDNEMNTKANALREAGFARVENAYWVEHWQKGNNLIILERCDESERPTTPETSETMNEQTKQYFRNVYGSYQNLCEQVNERLAILRAELQEYHDNHSKGGSLRKKNIKWLQEDIKKLEQMKEECKQAFEIKETATVTVSITEGGNKCEYIHNGKVLASIAYRKEFDAYDVNTPSAGYMTTDIIEAHKACESGINHLLNTSAVFDYSAVEEYNEINYPQAV